MKQKSTSIVEKLLLVLLLIIGTCQAKAENYLPGSWHSNFTVDETVKFTNGSLTLSLSAETTYEFKINDTGTGGGENNWFSNTGTMTFTNCKGWTFSTTVSTNCKITTTIAGDYIFKISWVDSTPTISVTYPSEQGGDDDPTPTPTPISSDAKYYLVGNFFGPNTAIGDNGDENINYDRRYFMFNVQSDGSYMTEIPASVTAKMQILGVSGTTEVVYGPGSVYGINSSWPTTNSTVPSSGTAALTSSTTKAEGSNYWNLVTRNNNNTDDDGLYEVSFTLGADGQPATWSIKHVMSKRVAYFLSRAAGATAQPVYNTRQNNISAAFSNKTYAALYIDPLQKYFTIGYVLHDNEYDSYSLASGYGAHLNKNNESILPTTNKLFLLGNTGLDYVSHNPNNEVSPNESPIAPTSKSKGTYMIEYNPSNGNTEWARNQSGATGKDHLGIRGQFMFIDGSFAKASEPITSISMVGNAVPGTTNTDGTWDWASTVGDMTYDETEKCYKLTITTTNPLSEDNRFRFVANHTSDKTWYEDGTTDDKKARLNYQYDGDGHSCLSTDPNPVSFSSTDNTSDTDVNIIFNRPAGEWTVRFYIDVQSVNGNAVYSYKYTINGAPGQFVTVTPKYGKLLRSYSTSKNEVIPNGYRAYVAHRYEAPEQEADRTQQNSGTVHLYRIKYIPANVGVILWGEGTTVTQTPMFVEKTSGLTYGTTQEEHKSIWWYTHDGETFNNYLVANPTVNTTVTVGDYTSTEEEKYHYTSRNFSFTWYSKTTDGKKYTWDTETGACTTSGANNLKDYPSFFRCAGTIPPGYAYLSLPSDDTKDPGQTFGAMTFYGQYLTQDQDEKTTENKPLFAKSFVVFEDLDDFSDIEQTATAINTVQTNKSTVNDNVYYNLQGMKTANPSHGIFIYNGKKIIR